MGRKDIQETDTTPLKTISVTDPALNAAVTTSILDTYSGVIITTTGVSNAQTLQNPSSNGIKRFSVINNDTSTNAITINGTSLDIGNVVYFVWDGSAWVSEKVGGVGDMVLADIQINNGLKTFLDGTLGLRNVANTFTSFLTNINTAVRTYTLPDFSGVLATLTGTETYTNKRITKRAPTITQSATPAINTDITDVAHITGLTQDITSMTSSLTGTPVEGDMLKIDFTDNGVARAITWGTSFEASTIALPIITVVSTRLETVFVWNTITSKWRIIGVA